MRLIQFAVFISACAWSALAQSAPQPDKPVVAHFMIGTIYSYTTADWQADIAAAQAMGVTAFALVRPLPLLAGRAQNG
jgi:glucan endo-1,3-alpha-glucosidase